MPNYGQNVITNSTGIQDTTGWTVSGAAAVTGGTDAGGYCFRINSTGNMKQEVTFTTQPLQIKVSAKFYSDVLNGVAPVRAYMKCTVIYTDKEPDEYYIPCTGGIFDYVSGTVNGQDVNWVSLESSFNIDDQKTLQKVVVELVCENLGTYGYFDDIQVLPLIPDPPDLRAKNGEQIVDEYGINPDFVKASQNVVKNSSFEQFDVSTNTPKYWTTGTISEDASAFDGAYVLKLTPGQTTQQTTDAGVFPDSWGGGNGRLSFYHRGGAINVYIITTEGRTLPLYDKKDDPTTTVKPVARNDGGWVRKHFGIDVSSLRANEKLLIRFTNTDNIDAFIDAVQMEEDFNGAHPSFYTSGPLEATLSSFEVVSKDKIVILNNQGINPYYTKHSQNLVKNSSFEIYDMFSKYHNFNNMTPLFWGGNCEMSQDVPAVDGKFVLKIFTRAFTYVDISSLEGSNGRLSFYHRGGLVSLNVYYYDDSMKRIDIPLIDDKNQRQFKFDIPKNDNGWKRYSFGVDLSEAYTDQIIINFSGTTVSYIDAVQFEKDVSGMWPSFYSRNSNDDTNISIIRFKERYVPPEQEFKKSGTINILDKTISLMDWAYVIFFFDVTFEILGKTNVLIDTNINNQTLKRVGGFFENEFMGSNANQFYTISYFLFKDFTHAGIKEFTLTLDAYFYKWPDRALYMDSAECDVLIVACRSLQNFLSLVRN